MATIKDIAKRAGVSIGTVDRVLHDRGDVKAETKAQVRKAVEELDYRPNLAAKGLAVRKKKIKLCFLLINPQKHSFFADVEGAARKKVEELREYGVQVTFVLLEPKLSQVLYEKTQERFTAEDLGKFDGFVTIGGDYPLTNAFLEKAKDVQMPVVYYNLSHPTRKGLAYVGCDYVKAGRVAAGLSALAGGRNAKVCIYSEDYFTASSHVERLNGFCREARERYPEMEIVDVRKIGKDSLENERSVKEMLKMYPGINVVYVVNTVGVEIYKAIASLDKEHRIRIITNDLSGEQWELLKREVISATVCQEPEKQGKMPLEILFRYLAYGMLPEEKECYTDLSINIAQIL